MHCGDGDPRLAVGGLGVVVGVVLLALRLAVALRLAGGAVIGGARGDEERLQTERRLVAPPTVARVIRLVIDGVNRLAKLLGKLADLLLAERHLAIHLVGLVLACVVLGEILNPLLEGLAGADLALGHLLQGVADHLVGQGGHAVRTDGVLSVHPPNHAHPTVALPHGEDGRPEILAEAPVQEGLDSHFLRLIVPQDAMAMAVAELLDGLLGAEQGFEDLRDELMENLHPRVPVGQQGGDGHDGLLLVIGVVEAEHKPGRLLNIDNGVLVDTAVVDHDGDHDREVAVQFVTPPLDEHDATPHTFRKFTHVHHVSPDYRPKTVAVLVVSTPNIRGSFDIIW